MTYIHVLSLLAIPVGFYVLIWGADRFVEGASALAKNYGVSPLIIGLTIVGFATSAPEMLISAFAAMDNQGGLAIGNAIGSNITNIALVLGFSVLLAPLIGSVDSFKKEMPILLACMALATYLMFDRTLSQSDGIILLVGLLILFSTIIWRGLKNPKSAATQELMEDIPDAMSSSSAVLWLVLGLAALLASSKGLVWGAVNIAQLIGISDLIIGLTIVALGTSLPELAATIAAVKKQQADLAIGNIIGSNMFNILGVVGIAGTIQSTAVVDEVITRDIPVMFGITLLMLVLGLRHGFKQAKLTQLSGGLLFASYVGYMAWLCVDSIQKTGAST